MATTEHGRVIEQLVHISAGGVILEGSLAVPEEARGVVLFAHGSGSSRHSPRNRAIADELHQGHLATLLMDLLTAEEELEDNAKANLRFNVEMLGNRLEDAVDWLGQQEATKTLAVGLFGASTGAAAALAAAAHRAEVVRAVVSRGGRPDLAGSVLGEVKAPTLMIVGGQDTPVVGMNQQAMEQMQCPRRLEIILGATHLFVEPGALQEVARLARGWFEQHLDLAGPRG
ncbi:MAG TPA: dienelactone hydrolase family protein [Tepidisphaeraceae bacterium]|nr:dienelactone hydrolase family protein [Tepidisphaeraceae bacterium]